MVNGVLVAVLSMSPTGLLLGEVPSGPLIRSECYLQREREREREIIDQAESFSLEILIFVIYEQQETYNHF